MEVRLIDESPHHAGKIVGTKVKVVSSNRTTKSSESRDHPAPFARLIERALNLESESIHHAGSQNELDRVHPLDGPARHSSGRLTGLVTNGRPPCAESSHHAGEADHRLHTSHKLRHDASVLFGPPATYQELEAGKAVSHQVSGVLKATMMTAPDPSTNEGLGKLCGHQSSATEKTKENVRERDQEAKGGLAQAGLSGVSRCQATGRAQVVCPRSIPASTVAYQGAGKAGGATESNKRIESARQPAEPMSVSGSQVSPPAPDSHQHAEIVRTDSRDSPPVDCQSAPGNPAPNHQNAEAAAVRDHFLHSSSKQEDMFASPPRPSAPQSQNAGGSEKASPPGLESQSPCAPESLSPIRRFLNYLWSKSAYNDPTKERTNFGWRRIQ
jgi:hypothetical protein